MLNGTDVFSCLHSRPMFRQVVNASVFWHKSIDKLTSKSSRRIAKARERNPIFSFGISRFLRPAWGSFSVAWPFPVN
jgi:hypothetical protein